MSHFKKDPKGELLIFLAVALWSFFPIITIFSFGSLPPLMSGGLSALFAAFFFVLWMLWKGGFSALRIGDAWKDVFMSILLIGVIFYGLVFIAIQKTTAGNASIFLLMEIFWAMGILRIIKGERVTATQMSGIFLSVLGAALILYQEKLHVNAGNLLIILATFFAPFGNHYAQKALKKVTSVSIMLYRSVVSATFLVTASFIWEPAVSVSDIVVALPFLAINGVFLFGISKILWLEGIKRIAISKATAFLTVAPALTLIFAFFLLGEVPTLWQLVGLGPIAVGIWMLTGMKVRGRG